MEVGPFQGLMHKGDGRVAYLYEATLRGPGRVGVVLRHALARLRVRARGQPEQRLERGEGRRRGAACRGGELRRDRGEQSGKQIAQHPDQADGERQADETAGRGARPPGDGAARRGSREHEQCEMRDVEIPGEGDRADIG